ncbi:hypothetical protein CYMTET_13095 [Cymbomonas tetramitiformis]|uniref:Uncharacterized protein n=1 Tax=Cymbomonas tetramitiformis TaxID=36881 RepID=A0AAE0LB76_9CHLO|nr:hypothetical protein CYMTET_13095 [Cymbomonas tetramitiformis]
MGPPRFHCTSFDERAAKLVIKKVYEDKTGRFTGAESNVSSVFARVVMALRDIFVTEEAAFSSLFDLEDATLPVRSEASMLLFSTLEYIVAPGAPTADLLATKITKHDPSRNVAAFNAALRSARRKSTLDDIEVKSLFIKSLDPIFFAPVANRLLLHDQRATESLATIQQWAQKYSALALSGQQHEDDFKTIFNELRDLLYDMKKEIKRHSPTTSRNHVDVRGPSKKVAFHKPSGAFVPLCGNPTCSATAEKHWHRDRPNGGPRGHVGAHGVSIADNEHDIFATLFQNAMESDDAARFDAVCYLAGGKPELYDTVSAFSFAATEERVPDTIDEYAAYCQPVENMSSFFVAGGATESAPVAAHHLSAAPSPPPPASDTGSDGEVYDGLLPAVNYNFDGSTATFADRFFTAFPEKNIKSELAPSVVVSYMGDTCTDNTELLDDSSDGEDIPPPEPTSQVSVAVHCHRCAVPRCPPPW